MRRSDSIVIDAPESLGVVDSAHAKRRRGAAGRPSVWVLVAAAWLGLVVFAVLFADLLPIRAYDRLVPGLPPRSGFQWGAEPLGTDTIGRSEFSRIIYGARPSLAVGVFSVSIAVMVGVPLGAVAGYFNGRLDAAVRLILDAALSLPAIAVLLAAAAIGRRDLTTLVIALAVVITPIIARLARATTSALVERESVLAARALGATHFRILTRELLPEVALRISPLIFLIFGQVVVAEGTLSFLGLGLAPPTPTWGGMVNEGRGAMASDPLLLFAPAFCLFATVTAFTILGEALRKRFDRRESGLK